MLRPINVPFKNKWIRDVSSNLAKQDAIKMSSYDEANHDIILLRVVKDLNLCKPIENVALKLQKKFKDHIFNDDNMFPVFDVIACIFLAFKLLYGLNDSENLS